MWIWILFLTCFAHGKAILLPTVDVEGDPLETESIRSINWPLKSEKVTPAIILPQLDDAINTTNGIQMRTQGSPTFSIRGSAQSGRALLLYEHIPLNFATGFGAPNVFLPKEVVQSLMVVKGPASLFYGSQAMSGAIDFYSKTYLRPEVTLSFSDTNESFLPWRQGRLAQQSYQLATPLYHSQHSHWQSSFFYEDDDGQFPFQNQNTSGVRDFNSSNLSRMVLKGRHQGTHWRWDFNSILGKQILQSPGPINFPLNTRQESNGLLVSVSPHVFLTEKHSIKSRLSYLKSEAQFLESGNTSYTNMTTGIWQNEWIYDIKRDTKLQFFADAFFHRLDSNFSGDNLTQSNLELGPFFNFHWLKGWTQQIGGRYLTNSQKFLPTLSTHFYYGNKDTWLSYSEGFRNPSLSDLYSQSPYFVGNANLKPETSQQVELGIKNKDDYQFLWEARVFHIEYKNFIESNQISPTTYSRENRGSGYSRGLDLSGTWKGRWLQPSLNYNYLDSKSRELNRPFRLSPRHQITLGALLDFSKVQFQVQNTHWYKTIDVNANQPVDLQNWQQWNFFLHYYQWKGFRVSLGLINAFNEGKQLTLNYPEPQRKYWLQIHQSF